MKKQIILLAALCLFCCATVLAASPFAAIEVIAKAGKKTDAKAMMKLAKDSGLPASAVYQWNNHLVLYGELKHVNLLQHDLENSYPKCEVKVYQNPFYDFDRSHCDHKDLVKQWDNILLTANLVADPKMQQEYLNYHATQFQKWPEVSQGFCNARFQQLLVFKNGRQLMLVISIPHGESLDKLNPLTSKNNPRVDDWNRIMSKYQEGIPGTKKGESWVFLKPVGN